MFFFPHFNVFYVYGKNYRMGPSLSSNLLLLVLMSGVCVLAGVIYHGSRAVPGTADVVHKLKKLVLLSLMHIHTHTHILMLSVFHA